MNLPDDYALLVFLESRNPAEVAAMFEHLVGAAGKHPGQLPAPPRVSPPPAWVRAKQRGPVAIAAWAARYCDDADTL